MTSAPAVGLTSKQLSFFKVIHQLSVYAAEYDNHARVVRTNIELIIQSSKINDENHHHIQAAMRVGIWLVQASLITIKLRVE